MYNKVECFYYVLLHFSHHDTLILFDSVFLLFGCNLANSNSYFWRNYTNKLIPGLFHQNPRGFFPFPSKVY